MEKVLFRQGENAIKTIPSLQPGTFTYDKLHNGLYIDTDDNERNVLKPFEYKDSITVTYDMWNTPVVNTGYDTFAELLARHVGEQIIAKEIFLQFDQLSLPVRYTLIFTPLNTNSTLWYSNIVGEGGGAFYVKVSVSLELTGRAADIKYERVPIQDKLQWKTW